MLLLLFFFYALSDYQGWVGSVLQRSNSSNMWYIYHVHLHPVGYVWDCIYAMYLEINSTYKEEEFTVIVNHLVFDNLYYNCWVASFTKHVTELTRGMQGDSRFMSKKEIKLLTVLALYCRVWLDVGMIFATFKNRFNCRKFKWRYSAWKRKRWWTVHE